MEVAWQQQPHATTATVFIAGAGGRRRGGYGRTRALALLCSCWCCAVATWLWSHRAGAWGSAGAVAPAAAAAAAAIATAATAAADGAQGSTRQLLQLVDQGGAELEEVDVLGRELSKKGKHRKHKAQVHKHAKNKAAKKKARAAARKRKAAKHKAAAKAASAKKKRRHHPKGKHTKKKHGGGGKAHAKKKKAHPKKKKGKQHNKKHHGGGKGKGGSGKGGGGNGGGGTGGGGKGGGKRGPLRTGVADWMSIQQREDQVKADIPLILLFQSIQPGKDDIEYKYLVKNALDTGKQVTLVIQFRSDSHTNLPSIAQGKYDDILHKFIDEWKGDGNRRLAIRPLHEFNSDWWEWGTFRKGDNTKDAFKRAFQHVVKLFRKRGANASYQLAYNCDNPYDDKTPFTEWWPGEEYVDMVVCSGYNRAGISKDFDYWQTFTQVFSPGYKQMAALPGGKPLGVGETGTTSWGGHSKAEWIRGAFNALMYDFPRVQECYWLLRNKQEWGSGNWDLNTKADQEAFGAMLRKYDHAENGVGKRHLLPTPAELSSGGSSGAGGDRYRNAAHTPVAGSMLALPMLRGARDRTPVVSGGRSLAALLRVRTEAEPLRAGEGDGKEEEAG